jgi:membrane protease YdiL (CAAX protease family)
MSIKTIKRLVLVLLTVVAIAQVGLSLVESWGQPQIQSRLQLYQTNLILHAAELQDDKPPNGSGADITNARTALLGQNPFETAQKQYQDAREEAQTNLKTIQAKLAPSVAPASTDPSAQSQYPPVSEASAQQPQRQQSASQVEKLLAELDVRIGILQAQQGKTTEAINTWTQFIERAETQESETALTKTAAVLIGLWSEPSRLLPDAESQIQQNLDSWFRYRALTKLYKLQQRQEALSSLQAQEQEVAEKAAVKLAIVGGIPAIGGVLGVGTLVFLAAQLLLQGKQSLLSNNSELTWTTPWDWETIWQVLIFGFFFIGQILLPLIFGLVFSSLGSNPATFGVRMKAIYVMLSYLLLAGGGLLVLYISVKPYFPLPEGWFRFQWRGGWILWGVGGYFAALPLVVLVSLINQQIWKGQGGSNPILPLALEGRDSVALSIFFLTASVAAPAFEEIIFRGFLLPSLTRYMPIWGAIVASSFLFAIAHLSLSEVLPLATLGMILAVVYTRSRNLFAPMLLHSLWNAGTLLSLYALGSGVN